MCSSDLAVARAEAIENVTSDDEAVFDESRHSREIQRSEDLAAGLPPDISDEAIKEREEQKSADSQAAPTKAKRGGQGNRRGRKGRTREPEKPFEPVEVPDQPPQGIVETIKAATDKVIERVKRVFIPLSKSHKELIINARELKYHGIFHPRDLFAAINRALEGRGYTKREKKTEELVTEFGRGTFVELRP